MLLDEDVAAYADFSKDEIVWAMPHLPQAVIDFKQWVFGFAKSSIVHCHSVLGKARRAEPGAPKAQGTTSCQVFI